AFFTVAGGEVGTVSSRDFWSRLPEGRLEWQRAMSEVRLCNVASGQKLQQVRLRTTNLTQLAVSPLGTYIVAAYADGAVEVMDGRLRIQQRPGSSSSRVMPVIKPLATIVQIGELPEPPEMNESGAPPNAGRVMPHSGRVNSLAISPDEKFLVTAGADGNTLIHTLPSGQCTRVQRANGSRQGTPNDAVLQVAFSPDGRRIATLTGAGTVEFWNVPQGGAVGPLDHPIPGATSLVFSPDGRFVAVSKSGEVRVWDVTSGQPASVVLMHAAAVTSVSFNPDGTLLLTASLDGGVRLWDLTIALPSTSPLVDARLASRPATRSQSSRDPLISCFSPDEARVATVADAGSVRVWESATGRPITPVIRPGVDTDSMAFSHDGGRLVVAGGGSGGRVQVFDATSGAAISPVLVLDTLVRHLAFTPDDRCLVITGVREALMFDAVSGAAVPVPVPSAPPIRDLAFSADGRWVASCSEAPASEAEPACVWEVNVRDVATGESSVSPLRIPGVRVEPFSGSAPELAFSEDSRWLAVKCWRGLPSTMAEHAGPKWHAFVTELRRGAAFTPVPGDFMGCFFAIHPDRLFLLNGRTGNTVVRDLAHGENVTVRQPQEYDCVPREVSRNGAWLLGSTQGGWRIWELATGEAVTPILEDVLDAGPDTQRACFRSDGGVVLAGTFMMPRLWPVVPDRRPVDAIARGVQLLAARELDEFGSMVPLSPARLMELWHSEGASHVVTGGASTNQVVWWHLCQAGRSERSGDWFAAEFHLSRLLDTSGDGTQTRQRLAHARNQTLFELLNRTQ
ncbi:MAG: hypothetical protein KDM81_07365, partial [Verrucomicrobiae bacterium]|nr:hypothetical protein [Verrucomicrobiae bacterium]